MTSTPIPTTSEEIISYYDRCEVHYKMHWNLAESHSLHYGYWDDTTDTFHEALLNTNHRLAKYGQIRSTDRVLDAGCGVGGSALFLANMIGCECVGITLSQKQVDSANKLAAEKGLKGRCTFQVRDFTKTGYPDQSFDVVWAVESVCHANDKADFIKEAYRLLKPGGRLIMADFFQTRSDLSSGYQYIMDQWAAGWAIPFFEVASHFESKLQAQGFDVVHNEDASDKVEKSARRLYVRFWPGWIGAKLYRLFNPGTSAISMANVWTAYYQWKGLKQGSWRYKIYVGQKK